MPDIIETDHQKWQTRNTLKHENDAQILLAVNHNIWHYLPAGPFLARYCKSTSINMNPSLSSPPLTQEHHHHHWLQFNFFLQNVITIIFVDFFFISYVLFYIEMWRICMCVSRCIFLCGLKASYLIWLNIVAAFEPKYTQVYLFYRQVWK